MSTNGGKVGVTPWPWRFEEIDDGVHCASQHVWGPKVSIQSGGNLDYTRSDMQLIAAAPDLLEALKELYADYKMLAASGDAGNWKLEDTEAGKQARAAIARAEGEG